MTASTPANRAWTYAGLAIALFGAPLVVMLFKLAGFTRADFGATVVRELIILALVAILFWIIRSREKLPLSSIGLRRQKVVPAVLWSFAVMLLFGVGIAACLIVFPLVGLSYGSSSGPAVPMGVSLLIYARAGIAEEVFYRGYAIERVEALTGKPCRRRGHPAAHFRWRPLQPGRRGHLDYIRHRRDRHCGLFVEAQSPDPDHRAFHGRFHSQHPASADLRGLTTVQRRRVPGLMRASFVQLE